MSEWMYQGQVVREPPEGSIGFIYMITRISDGKFYVGKKLFNSTRRKVLTKKEKLLKENKRKTYKTVVSDSNWLDYWSSCKELIADVKTLGKEAFSRQILCFCENKTEWTYLEVKYQFYYDVLNANSYNANIMSRFFKNKNQQND